MNLSKKGFDLINHFETGGDPSRYLKAYWDKTGKVWTIGIGSTKYENRKPVMPGDVITLERAHELFNNRIKDYVSAVEKKLEIPVTQAQFDALVSLAYNNGPNGFPTLMRMVNAKKPLPELARQWFKHVTSGGVVLNGLKWRRASEFYLFATGRLVTDRVFLKKLYESRAADIPPAPGPGSGGTLLAVLLVVAFFFLVR